MPDIALRFNKDMLVVEGPLVAPLMRQGFPEEESLEELGLLDGELIHNLHRQYLDAGANCVVLTTALATENQLKAKEISESPETLVKAAARCVSGLKPEHVFGAIASCGLFDSNEGAWEENSDSGDNLDEFGHDPRWNAAFAQYFQLAQALAQEDLDAFLISGMTSIEDACCALQACKKADRSLPVMVTCVFDSQGDMPLSSSSIETAAEILTALGADVLGIDAGHKMDELIPLAKRLVSVSSVPVLTYVDVEPAGRKSSASTDLMTRAASELMALGVQFIAPGKGATPAHVGAIWSVVADRDVVIA